MSVKILVTVEDTEVSKAAEDACACLAKFVGAEVTLFHTTDTSGVKYKNLADNLLDSIRVSARNTAHRFLTVRSEAMAKRSGVLPRIVSVQCDPAECVIKEAKRGYDLVVMGTEVHSDLRYMFLGSVSNSLIKESPVPVVVIKKNGPNLSQCIDGKPVKALVAVDDSNASRRCVEALAKLAIPNAFKITLVHVMSKEFPTSKDPEATLDRNEKRLTLAGYTPDTILAEGDPGRVIAEICEVEGFEMIIAGKSRGSELRETPAMAVGHYLYHHSKAHQMIVP